MMAVETGDIVGQPNKLEILKRVQPLGAKIVNFMVGVEGQDPAGAVMVRFVQHDGNLRTAAAAYRRSDDIFPASKLEHDIKPPLKTPEERERAAIGMAHAFIAAETELNNIRET